MNTRRRKPLSIVTVKSGRFEGREFRIENELKDMPGGIEDLAMLACNGNMAALNAINIDGYKYYDGPFYYGKINGLGFIISHKDLPQI